MYSKLLVVLLVLSMFGHQSDAGLAGLFASYGLCQTACNAAWVLCCSTAGVAAGTVTAGAGAAPAVLACSAIQGTCMAACATAFLVAPTP